MTPERIAELRRLLAEVERLRTLPTHRWINTDGGTSATWMRSTRDVGDLLDALEAARERISNGASWQSLDRMRSERDAAIARAEAAEREVALLNAEIGNIAHESDAPLDAGSAALIAHVKSLREQCDELNQVRAERNSLRKSLGET
jgi:hypothetical protein